MAEGRAVLTTIVAFAHRGDVWMGTDSQETAGWTVSMLSEPKMFVKGNMLIGCAGLPRMAQIVQYEIDLPDRPEGRSTLEYLVRDVVAVWREAFKERGVLETVDGREVVAHFEMLIAYEGTIYEVDRNWSVMPRQRIAALGSGYEFGLGAMEALLGINGADDPDLDAAWVVREALRVAALLDANTGGTLYVWKFAEDGTVEKLLDTGKVLDTLPF